jgi:hypothetical protein
MLPIDAKRRKQIPLYTFLTQYFPDAIAALVDVSVAGNAQHNPGEPLHWSRGKSTDQLDAAMRHLFDHGCGIRFGHDGQRTLAQAAWRLMAQLQLDLEKEALVDKPYKEDRNGDNRVYKTPIGEAMQNKVESVPTPMGGQHVSVRTHQEGCDAPRLGEETWCAHHQQGYIQGSGEGATWCETGEFCKDG